MIEMKDNSILITDRFADFAKGFDRQRSRIVVAHDVIHIQQYDLSGFHLPSGFSRKNLFNKCSHKLSPFID